jgi:cytoskeletal protein RodZ
LARRRRRERAAGIAVVLLGIVVAAVAIFALRNPKTDGTKAGQTTGRVSSSTSASAAPTRSGTPSTSSSSSSASSSVPPGSSSASSSPATGTKLPLVVLNNTTTKGLAQGAADRFTAGGWTVTKFDNYQNDIVSTAAYFDPAVDGAEAAADVLQQQFPTIKRVVPQFAELAVWNSPIVVILTRDYQP